VRVLVLGGTRFVGRALVQGAMDRGWDVTVLNRGLTGELPPGVTPLFADRTSESELRRALGDGEWDLVVDTWSGSPVIAGLAARMLAGRARRYGYVSSRSVYSWGTHVDERSPVVDGDPTAIDGDYAALKRGSELAILASFPSALLARAGLILGPHEDIGRLPWWLNRAAAGGQMVAPGRPDRPLQYIDARDLAAWMLTALDAGLGGVFDSTSRSGHATTRQLLEACVATTGAHAELIWIPEAELAEAGAAPWTQLPCWVPETGDFAGFMEADTGLAARAGLVVRPIDQTVHDTWRWMQREGSAPQRADRDVHGLPLELERSILLGHAEIDAS
jgi:nucleoside-diphosphate-sugar epimerase